MAKAKVIYELKVTLLRTRPPIWRRVQVTSDATLAGLHEILQTAMGWTDSHMHRFEADEVEYGTRDAEDPELEDERKVRLAEVLRERGDRMLYEYDFGDSWEHEVLLEKVFPAEKGSRYPLVIDGKRACPPEDCGGVPGYYSLLKVLRNPSDPEHAEMKEWIGGPFDPESFSAASRNRAFHGGWGPADEDA